MSVQITDCTIRDGGYLFNKNSAPEFVKGIMKGLAEAGIDYVETGFLQKNVTGESLVYKDSGDVIKYLPDNRRNTQFWDFVIIAGIHWKIWMIIMGNLLNGCEFLLHNMKLMNLWNFAKVRKIRGIWFNSIRWIQ